MNKAKEEIVYNVLLVEDNTSDILLLEEALNETQINISLAVAHNGEKAMNYLHRGLYEEAARPDLVLLDLNLPVKHGFKVLEEMKEDSNLKNIPVIILSTSTAQEDIERSYKLHANCYINKPFDMEGFINIIRSISSFWLQTVKLPRRKHKLA